jgi:CheY-like chemotaxis protein
MNQNQLIQNIYYADDDQDDVLLFKDVFVELGHPINLTIAENGIVLLEKLLASRQHPDVIFMDLNMPLKNGFQCLKEIKTHTSLQAIPVVILSTSSAMDNIEKSYQLGAFLLKTEIEKCLVKVIGRHQN